MTQHTRTNYEQLPISAIDNVSGVVYNADQLSRPQQGRQVYYTNAKPHSHSAVLELFQNCLLGRLLPFLSDIKSLTQRCVKNSEGA